MGGKTPADGGTERDTNLGISLPWAGLVDKILGLYILGCNNAPKASPPRTFAVAAVATVVADAVVAAVATADADVTVVAVVTVVVVAGAVVAAVDIENR